MSLRRPSYRPDYVPLTIHRPRLIEIQAILVELIERFAFATPEDMPEIVQLPAGLATPIVKGEEAVGAQMPLQVTPI